MVAIAKPVLPVESTDFLPGARNVTRFTRDRLAFVSAMWRRGRDIARVRLGPFRTVLVSEPELIKQVLGEHQHRYNKDTHGIGKLRAVLGNGLVTSEGDFWRRQRRIAQPAFHRHRINGLAETMITATDDMLKTWRDGDEFDASEELNALTLRIIGQTMLSVDVKGEAAEIGDALTEVLEFVNEAMVNPFLLSWMPTPRPTRYRRALKKLDGLVEQIIAERRTAPGEHHDLLAMLMEARDEETGEGMTDLQLRDEVMTMFLAGHETTANALAWTFYLLSKHPAVLRRLQNEVDSLDGRVPTLGDMRSFAYTSAVVQESMRLFPPVWMIARRAQEAHRVGDEEINPGDTVFMSAFVVQRDPRWWPNPEGFDPERFMDTEAQRPKYAYFPFGGGPRICIGKSFAMMEAVLITAMIAQRFELALEPGARIAPDPGVTLRPRYGVPVQARAR